MRLHTSRMRLEKIKFKQFSFVFFIFVLAFNTVPLNTNLAANRDRQRPYWVSLHQISGPTSVVFFSQSSYHKLIGLSKGLFPISPYRK